MEIIKKIYPFVVSLSCVDMWPRSRGNLCSEFRKSIHWLMSSFLRRNLLCFLLQHTIKLSMTAFNVFFAPLEQTKPILQPINTINSACKRLVFIVSSHKTPAIPQKMSKTRQNEKSFLLFIAIHHTHTHTHINMNFRRENVKSIQSTKWNHLTVVCCCCCCYL